MLFTNSFIPFEKIEMDAKGVFIRSTENQDDIIRACKDLIDICVSGGKIVAAAVDDKYGGIKLYLNRDEVIQKFLSRRFLLKGNGEILATIHPETTQLIVRDAKFLMEKEFIERFKLLILNKLDIKYHQILEIANIPFSEQHPDVLTTDLRIILDIPEIEDLYVFKEAGLPDDIEIPTGTENEILSLNFYCPTCKKGGHTSWSCPRSIRYEEDLNSSQKKSSMTETPYTPKSQHSLPSHEREVSKDISIPQIISYSDKMGMDKFEKTFQEDDVRYSNFLTSLTPNTPGSSKKKVEVPSSSTVNRSLFPEKGFQQNKQTNEPSSKKARTSLINNEPEESDESSEDDHSENDICIIPASASTKNVQQLNPTSEGVEPDIEEIYNVNTGGTSPNPGPSSLQVLNVRIPPRIKEMWEPLCSPLSMKQVEAFLDHAKSKQNVRKLATLFDNGNYNDLKEQFTTFRKAYYNEKRPPFKEAYKEEKEFMDWFEGLLNRMI